MPNFNLALPFQRSRQGYPDRLALAGEDPLTYQQAADLASRIATWIRPPKESGQLRVAILASRSVEACLSALAATWAGATYVPLNLKLPEDVILNLLGRVRPDALLVDWRGLQRLTERVRSVAPSKILFPKVGRHPHGIVGLEQLPVGEPAPPFVVQPDDIAYIIFTSGTTGQPKGVMVSAASVTQLVRVAQERLKLTCLDRVADSCDLYFDGSVFNMFVTWNAAASLHIIPPGEALSPARLIVNSGLSACLLVPSVLAFMQTIKAVKPGAFPSLRLSLFGGEVLSLEAATAWQEAAPNSRVYNLYGPTEATVFCLLHEWTNSSKAPSLGLPLPGTQATLLDPDLAFLAPGQTGQLGLSGIQCAAGYLDDPQLSAARFPILRGQRWYLTGDLCSQDQQGVYHYLGRTDHQVKVMGNRVELEEVEAALRSVAQCAAVAALAWPVINGLPAAIVGFVAGTGLQADQIRRGLQARLPTYAVPSRIICRQQLPLSGNGKIDRPALLAWLEANP